MASGGTGVEVVCCNAEGFGKIEIYGPIETWSTMEQVAIVQLIKTLTNLMKWGEDIFLPHFLEHVAFPGWVGERKRSGEEEAG